MCVDACLFYRLSLFGFSLSAELLPLPSARPSAASTNLHSSALLMKPIRFLELYLISAFFLSPSC